jgi:putative PIN family toxin of toxin-antitoxin system
MMRVILDTNVIVSGLAAYDSVAVPPARILRAWVNDAFVVMSSEPMRAEVERTLNKPYFLDRVPTHMRRAIEAALGAESTTVALAVHVSGVATHPEDDLVLATAASARADYLVTGDRQLLRLGSFKGVSIISPADFARVLDEQDAGRSDPATR